MENIIPKKELEIVKKSVASADSFSQSLKITSKEDYDGALAEGKAIKARLDAVVEQKEVLSKPAYATYKGILTFFKPFEETYEKALKVVKAKMVAYSDEQARIAASKIEKVEARVEKGTMRENTAGQKIAEIKKEVAPTVVTEAGKATTKQVPKYRLVDLKLIPAEFLKSGLEVSDVADMKKVKASFDLEKPVPGVEKYYVSEVSLG